MQRGRWIASRTCCEGLVEMMKVPGSSNLSECLPMKIRSEENLTLAADITCFFMFVLEFRVALPVPQVHSSIISLLLTCSVLLPSL